MSTIRLKRSAEPKKVPSFEQLELGEVAVNTYDGKMFLKREQNGEMEIREFGARDVADNVFYVTLNGSNENDGKTIGDAFATIDHALKNIPEGSTLYVKAGQHTVDNPVKLPAFVAIVGDSLRTSFVQPKNPDKDIFWVNNGCFLKDMRFNNYIAPSAAVSFPPDGSAGSIMCSPYVQNCTSYTTTGTGMRVDGSVVTGLRSMVVDAYTQYNQGGIGVHHLNRGNTQLVSIFTISCDISIMCETGGFCSLTNSNTSFGNYGLISDGYSEALFSASAGAIQSRNSMIFNDLVNIPYIQNAAVFSDTDAVYTIKDATPIKVGQGIVNAPSIANQAKDKTDARDLILAEKERIQKATVEFVKNTYQTGAGFDEAKCARDSALILEGAGWDTELGTNYNSVTNGLAYQRANSKFVISNQLDATLGAIGYLRDATDIVFNTNDQNGVYFAEIIDIIENGAVSTNLSANALTFNDTLIDNPRSANVKDGLQTGKEYFAYDLEAWIAAQVTANAANTSSIWYQFTYDTEKCRRDVAYLIDAVTYDLMYGGDSAIKTAIESYFVGATLDQISGQEAATAAAYNQLAIYLETYINSGSVPGNAAVNEGTTPPSIVGGFDSNTTKIAEEVKDGIDLVATTITAGTLSGLTAKVYPDLGLLNASATFTADSGTTYDSVTGDLVLEIGTHSLDTQDAIRLSPNSLTFTCAYDGNTTPLTYPDVASEAFNVPLKIQATTATTITVNVGPARGAAAGSEHRFESATDDGVQAGSGIAINNNSAADVSYNETTGILTINATGHGLEDGQAVRLAKESLVFTCAYDPTVPLAYPNASSPAFDRPLTVTKISNDQFTVDIGPATGDAAGSAHTFQPTITVGDVTYTSALESSFILADKDQIDTNVGNILDGDTEITGTFYEKDGATVITEVTSAIGLFTFINTQFNFTFDQTKCARDIGLILDAVAHDVALDSTYRSYTQGLSYSRANADYLITNQQEQTAQSIEYIRDDVLTILEADANVSPATEAAYSQKFTIILDLLRNKAASIYAVGTGGSKYPEGISWTAPTEPTVDTNFVDAGTQLFTNRAYIQMAVLQFISDYYSDVFASSMDKAACIRDTGFIIDALRYDLTYGITSGNAATYDAALAYYVGNSLQLGSDEKVATLDAFTFLGDVAKYVIQDGADTLVGNTDYDAGFATIDLTSFAIDNDVEVAVAATYTGTPSTIKTGGDASHTAQASRADTLANVIVSYIDTGNLASLPTRTEPDVANLITATEASQLQAFTTIMGASLRTRLLEDVIVFAEQNFRLLDFNQSKCYRDTGIIIEAAVDDMVLDTNYKSIVAGRLYSQNSAALVISDQKPETIAAIEFVKTEIDALGATPTEETQVLANIDIVIDHITSGNSVQETFTPYAADYDPSGNVNTKMKLYIGDHNFVAGVDSIVIADESLTFTCPSGGGTQTIVHPRSNTGTSAGGSLTGNSDPGFRTALPVVGADQTAGWIEVDLGDLPADDGGTPPVSGQVPHTFVSSTADSIADANAKPLFGNPNLVLPEITRAKEAIIKNRAYLVEEAVSFINQNYPLLGYNRETCERDVGLVIDALTYDFMFNSNFRSITAGRSYLRGALRGVNADRPLLVTETGIKGQLITSDPTETTLNVGSSSETVTVEETTSYGGYGGSVSVSRSVVVSDTVVPAEQKAATVSAFLHLKDMMKQMVSQSDAVQRIEDNMATIVNIIQDGEIAVPDTPLLTTPSNTDATKIVGTAGQATVSQTINNIVKNRKFLIAETKGFIEAEFPTVKDTYDDDGKCSRDLGFLLDAITYDLTYGGNLETSVAAQSYFSDVVAAADGTVDKLGNVSVEVEIDDTRLDSEGVVGVDLHQIPNTKTWDGSNTVTITTKTPHGLRDGYTVTIFDVNGPIRLNAVDFFVKVIDDKTFDIYEESTLTTAINTTNYTAYVNRGKVRVNNAEVIATVESYKHLATIIRTVAAGDALGATQQSPVAPAVAVEQELDEAATDSNANVRAGSLVQDVITTIENDSSNPVEELPVLEWVDGYSTQTYPVGFANASLYGDYQVLQGEKEDLQSAVTTYIEANFAYDKATCRRDLGFIIDAVLYDGLYHGNTESITAAKQYRSGGKLQIPELQKRATGDALTHLSDRVGDVLRSNRVAPTQDITAAGYVAQDTTTPATTITEIQRIQQYFTDAASVVRRDYFINDFIDVIDPDFAGQSKDGQEIKAKILAEKENLQVKTIKFIDNTFREFRFDRETCSRDVGLIIDAVAMDTVLGTNYNAIIAGLSYQRGSLSIGTVKDEQKPQTIAAIEFLKTETLAISGLSATGVARATAAFDEILDIFENGATSTRTAADVIVFDKTAAAGNLDQRKAHDLLIANRDILGEEIISWLDEQFTNFTYDEAKCLRDTKLIIEALALDNALNTNYNTVTVGLSYQRANASEVLTGQKIQTIAAVEHLKERIDELTTLSTQGRARTKRLLDTLLDILGGAFSYDSSYDSTDDAGAVENIEFVNPKNASQDQIDAKDQLRINRSFLASEVIAYIDTTFPSLDYVKSRCKRDVGFILDAISYDILYGGNSATVQAARSYFVDGMEQLGYDEGTATISGYERLKTVIEPVVLATSVGNQPTFEKTPGNAETQIVESDAASPVEVARLRELINIIIDVLRVGNLTGVPAETRPSITWADANLREDMLAFGVAAARAEFTPYAVEYAPTTGIMELSIGMHPFETGDKVSIAEGALAFTCASDAELPDYPNGRTVLYHPRTTDGTAFGNLLSVLEVSPTTITVNVGISTETSDHTFVAATNNSVTVAGKTGVAEQVVDYVNDEFVNFTYDIDKCARDVKLITEGVAKDIALTTNYNSVVSGISYLRANASKVQNAMQKAITVAAFTKLKELITATATTAGTAALATEAGNRVDTVISLFNNGGVAPALSFSSGVNEAANTARAAITSSKTALVSGVIDFIESRTDLVGSYDQSKCARDSLLILDAVTRDMVLGTNYNSVYAGVSYIRGSNSELLSSNQKNATVQALTHLKTKTLELANVAFKASDRTANTAVVNSLESNFNEVINIIDNNSLVGGAGTVVVGTNTSALTFTTPTALGVGSSAGTTNAFDVNYANALANLQANKTFIIEFAKQFNALNSMPTGYVEAKCLRDVGYILDGLNHDINYGGNIGTRLNAASYFEDAVLNQLPGQTGFDQKVKTLELYKALETVIRDVVLAASTDFANEPTISIVDTTQLSANLTVTQQIVADGLTSGTISVANAIGGTAGIFNIITDAVEQDSLTTSRYGTEPELEPSITWADADAQSAHAEVKQEETSLIDQTIAFINADLSYDQARCERDAGIIIDAVTYDVNYGGTTASKISALAYFVGAVSQLGTSSVEKTATIAAFRHLGGLLDTVAELATAELATAQDLVNKIVTWIVNGETYTPGAATTYDANTTGDNAGELVIDLGTPAVTEDFTTNNGSYDPTTGVMTLTTATPHNLAAGTFITIAKGGVSFSCDDGTGTPVTLTYPDADSPFLNRPIEILEATANEITVNVGIATNGYSTAHTWESGTFTAGAGFELGDKVRLKDNSIRFTCAYDAPDNTVLSYPNASSPVLGKAIPVLRISGNTITVNVGIATGDAANSAHTFISADANCVTTVPSVDKLFGTASETLTAGARKDVHDALKAARNTYATSVNAHTLATFPANTYDRTRCQRDVGYIVDALAYDVLYGGNSATREVARSYFSFALSQLGGTAEESKETRATLLAYDRLSDAVGTVTQGLALPLSTKANAAANITPYFASYDLAGPLEVFIGTHTFVVGDKVRIAADSLSFTCASSSSGTPGATGTIFKHPADRSSAAGGTDPALGVDLTITAVGELSFTVDVGAAPGGVGAHTFVGAADGAVSSAKVVQTTSNPANAIEAAGVQATLKIVTDVIRNGGVNKLEEQVLPVITNSSLALQNDFSSIVSNKTVAQEATLQFIDDRYTTFSYDQFKCSRDIALILDAVLSDTVLGGNYQSLLAGSSYYRASASIVFEDQLPETIRAIEFLRGEVKKVLTDPLFTATVAPGTYATPATRAITPVEAVENAKTSGKVYTGTPELARLEARFEDVLRTMEFGLVTNMSLNAPVTLVKGEVVSQEFTRATGVVKTAVENSTEVELISVSGAFNATNTLVASRSGALGVEPVQTVLAPLDTVDFADPVGITEDRRRAKDILLANKEFFVNEAVAFISETFPMLGYNRATCERDVSLVLDAVGYDLMFGSNMRSIVAGRSYARKGAEIVTKEQKKATLAAFQFIKTLAADAISSPLLSAAGFVPPQNKYTPQAATSFFTAATGTTYDHLTGNLTLEIGTHTLQVNDKVNIAPESVAFTCEYDNDTVALAYPDKDSLAYKTPVNIDVVTGTTITVNVGIATGVAVSNHTFDSAKANGVTVGGSTYYDVDTGDMMLDLGTNATNAGFEVGQDVIFADNSLTFTCEYDVNTPLTYPSKESTYFQKPVRITEVNGTTITVNVGPAINAAQGSVHTFISSTADSIVKGEARSEFIVTVQEDSYTLAKTGSFHIDGVEKPVMQLLPGRVYEFNQDDISNVYYGDLRHPMVFGDIRDGNLTVGGNPYKTGVTYLLDDVSVGLESYIRDFANSTTRRVRLDLTGAYTTEVWYHSAKNAGMGNQMYMQATGFENDKGAKVRLEKAMNTIIQLLDTGADTTLQLTSPVKFAKGTIITQENTLVEGEVASCDGTSVTLINVDGGKKLTVDAATTAYDVDTGILTVTTSATHGLSSGTKVLIRAGSLAFSCSSPNLGTLNYPDESSPAFNTPVAIFEASGSTFKINIGPATGAAAGKAHAFEAAASSLIDAISVAQFSLTDNLLVRSVNQNTKPSAVSSPPLPILPTPTVGTVGTAGETDVATTIANIESNRQFIVEEVQAYITESYPLLGFDRALCARDTGLVIDAVAWDLLNGSEDAAFTQTWRSITAARGYMRQTGAIVALPTDQVAATQAGFTYLGGLLEALITSKTAESDKARLQISNNIKLINAVIGGGAVSSRTLATPAAYVDADIAKTFTAGAGTTYAHLTGDMTIEIGTHNLSVGMEVAIKEDGITFNCDSAGGGENGGQGLPQSYPTAAAGGSPVALNRYIPITAVTATSITVNVGVATNAAANEVHTFVSGVADAIVPRALAANEATQVLTLNRDYIRFQLSEWIGTQITASAGNFNGFAYSGTKQTSCEDDTGHIVDALIYDLTYGGNLETSIAAQAYFSGATSEIPYGVGNEKAAYLLVYAQLRTIIGEVINGSHSALNDGAIVTTGVTLDTSVTVTFAEPNITETDARVTEIVDELDSDGFRDIVPVYPQIFGTTFAVATFNQFISERADIVPQVTEYIEDNFAYLEKKCRRDVNYILDAIRYDLTYGGTMESEIAARAYYSDEGVNKLNSIEEINATKDAYGYLSSIVQNIGSNDEAGTSVVTKQTTANGYASNSDDAGTTLDITDGNSGGTNPSYDFATGLLTLEVTTNHGLLAGDKIRLAPESIGFTCTYSGAGATAIAYPDTDAFAYDRDLTVISATSNTITVNVGRAAYPANSAHTFDLPSSALTNAITIVANGKLTESFATNTVNGTTSHATRAKALIDGMVSFIDNTLGDTTSYFDANASNAVTSWVDADLVAAHTTLQTEKAKIQALTTEFIEAFHAYKQTKCERDIRYIIDSVCYDLFYLGNSQVHLAAEQYFDGGNLQIPVPTKQATVDTFKYVQQLAEDVVRNVEVLALQTRVAQDTSLPSLSSADAVTQSARITDLFKVINNLIQHGYSSTVTFDINMTELPKIGETATFHQTSLITASGQTFEWVGSGTNIQQAVPYRGGQPIQDQQVVESNEGKVYFTSTDQTGDFKIGNSLTIERATGTITGDTFDRSLFAVLTPYILSLQ